jgi:amino acid permease
LVIKISRKIGKWPKKKRKLAITHKKFCHRPTPYNKHAFWSFLIMSVYVHISKVIYYVENVIKYFQIAAYFSIFQLKANLYQNTSLVIFKYDKKWERFILNYSVNYSPIVWLLMTVNFMTRDFQFIMVLFQLVKYLLKSKQRVRKRAHKSKAALVMNFTCDGRAANLPLASPTTLPNKRYGSNLECDIIIIFINQTFGLNNSDIQF